MKKTIAVLLSMSMVLALAGCKDKEETTKKKKTKNRKKRRIRTSKIRQIPLQIRTIRKIPGILRTIRMTRSLRLPTIWIITISSSAVSIGATELRMRQTWRIPLTVP